MISFLLIKRLIDIFLSTILIIVSVPILFLFSIIIFIEQKQFPFFFQERGITLSRFRFKIFKLKTLKPTTTENLNHNNVEEIFLKPALKGEVTKFAGWLRKTGLDELPQIFNIFLGQMSFIGPRPLMLKDLEIMKKEYPENYKERELMNSKPGLSGMWQIFGNRDHGVENLIGMDYLYDKYKNISLDFKLIMSTIPLVLFSNISDAILYKRKSLLSRNYFPYPISSNLTVKLKVVPKLRERKHRKYPKTEESYTIELPESWWYANDTYKIFIKEKNGVKIYQLDKAPKEDMQRKGA